MMLSPKCDHVIDRSRVAPVIALYPYLRPRQRSAWLRWVVLAGYVLGLVGAVWAALEVVSG